MKYAEDRLVRNVIAVVIREKGTKHFSKLLLFTTSGPESIARELETWRSIRNAGASRGILFTGPEHGILGTL